MARNSRISIDGKSSVDQGDWFPQQSVGSRALSTDLDRLYNYWGVLQQQFSEPVRRDKNGVPFRLCGLTGHYSPVAAFDAAPERPDGLSSDCRQCLKDQADKLAGAELQIQAEARARDAERKRLERRTARV